MAGELPVIYEFTPKLIIAGNLEVKHTFNQQISYNESFTQAFAVKYENGTFSQENSFKRSNNLSIDQSKDQGSGAAGISIQPEMEVRFYGVATASLGIGLNTQVTGTLALPSKYWDLSAKAWLNATIGGKLGIFGLNLAAGSKTFTTEPIEYTVPQIVKMISGDNQTADINKDLPQPIKVQVLGPDGKPQSFIRVLFKAENAKAYLTKDSSGKLIDSAEVFTDKDGFAQTKWTLYGENLEPQKVTATVKTGTLKNIEGSPLSFTAIPTAKVGDHAFGGTIYYIDATNKHGLVASAFDQGISQTYDNTAWGGLDAPDPAHVVSLSDTIGSGLNNTTTIISKGQPLKNIALLCTAVTQEGHKDWFLPSYKELMELYKAKGIIGGFSSVFYLSSTAGRLPNIGYVTAYINFANGKDHAEGATYFTGNVRAVRAF